MKPKISFVCQECGQIYARWQGQCEGCGSWNTLAEELVLSSKTKKENAVLSNLDNSNLIMSIEQTIHLNASFRRFSTGIEEMDRCLGTDEDGQKGLVQGGVVLIGGQPGIGKSTLLTQVVINWCRKLQKEIKNKSLSNEQKSNDNSIKNELHNKKQTQKTQQKETKPQVMYVCGEESPQQINLRIKRLLTKSEQLQDLPLNYVMTTDVELIIELIKKNLPELLIVDSVQTLKTQELMGQAGSLGQIKETTDRITRVVKNLGIPTFLVGHVTKEGEIAGPKVLEHMVDAIFELSGERGGELRFLRTLKNRFGANDEVGVFQMAEMGMKEVKNPSEYFLQSAQTAIPGSGVVCVLEGTRPLLTEVQALVVASQLAMPRRVGRGVDISRVQVLTAVLQKHCGFPLGVYDIFLSVVGGMTVKESGIDLGLAAALASSLAEKPLPVKTVFIGEVGLMGEIRPVAAFERRVKEAKRLGYEQIFSHQSHKKVKDLFEDLKIQ